MRSITVNQIRPATLPFPKLMKHTSGIIVLFQQSGKGVVVAETPAYPLGSYSDNWVMTNFSDFQGEVTLSN
jgi:hypothetical protein